MTKLLEETYCSCPVVMHWRDVEACFEGDAEAWSQEFDLPRAGEEYYVVIFNRLAGTTKLKITKHTKVDGPMPLHQALDRFSLKLYPGIIDEIKVVVPYFPLESSRFKCEELVKYYKNELSKGIGCELFRIFPTVAIKVAFKHKEDTSTMTVVSTKRGKATMISYFDAKNECGDKTSLVIAKKIRNLWNNSHIVWFAFAETMVELAL